MFDSQQDAPATQVLTDFTAVVDRLAALQLTPLWDEEILDLLRELEVQQNRLATLDHRLIGALHQRGTATGQACTSTSALLRQLLRLSPTQASARVAAAAAAGPRQTLTGDPLDPVHAVVAAAQAAGAISPAHARVIATTLTRLPTAVRTEHGTQLEQLLVTHATQFDPSVLAKLARHVLDVLNPDGTRDNEHDRDRNRDFTMTIRPDGSSRVSGDLTPACTEALATVLDTLSRPNPATTNSSDTALRQTTSLMRSPPHHRLDLTHRTSIDDGTLLCGFHHREHPRLGWKCQMIDGTPHWTAPTWIDPTQTPQRNRMHHPEPV